MYTKRVTIIKTQCGQNSVNNNVSDKVKKRNVVARISKCRTVKNHISFIQVMLLLIIKDVKQYSHKEKIMQAWSLWIRC